MSRLSEITQQQRDQLRENAVKAQTPSPPFIAIKDGRFKMGSDDISGSEFMAVPDECCAVWNYFPPSGGVEEILRVNMLDGKIPKRPDVHNDREQWETDWKSKRDPKPKKDPMGLQFELPLIDNESGRAIAFKASTMFTRELVGRLVEDFAEKVRRPFVTLAVNSDNVPEITITGYSEDLEDIELPGFSRAPGTPTQTNGSPTNGSKPSRASDINDDIPF